MAVYLQIKSRVDFTPKQYKFTKLGKQLLSEEGNGIYLKKNIKENIKNEEGKGRRERERKRERQKGANKGR